MDALISSFLEQGKNLASLLQEAKKIKPREDDIASKVQVAIKQLLENFKGSKVLDSFPDKAVLKKVLEKTEGALAELIKLDPENAQTYEDLVEGVIECKSLTGVQSAAVATSSRQQPDSDHQENLQQEQDDDDDGGEFAAVFASLNDKEKQCLICFSLFPAGLEIRKRELIHLWAALDLNIDDPKQVDEGLSKLESEGLIERIVAKKRSFNRYKMHANVRSMVHKQEATLWHIRKEGSWFMMSKPPSQQQQQLQQKQWEQQQQQQQQQQQAPSNSPTNGVTGGNLFARLLSMPKTQQDNKIVPEALVLNMDANILNRRSFESLSKVKNVKVLHLGNWNRNSKKYIVVEDIEVLKDLRHLEQVRVLSFQGVSGIVELPNSIYGLKNLKVLDLRACHNLELLPTGIDSLKQLTHLDLSECYLLDHIPKEITNLSELTVLKGFLINRDPQSNQQVGNGNGNNNICEFNELSNLKKLRKLTIRTRRMNFPTAQDLQTLCQMQELYTLKIEWVGNFADAPTDISSRTFPTSLRKLELQAAPKNIVSRLLRIVSSRKEDECLEKLYIRGGGLSDFGPHKVHAKNVRLRYLLELQVISWDEFRLLFPMLTWLEVFGCPNLNFFPCDENGVWDDSYFYPSNTL